MKLHSPRTIQTNLNDERKQDIDNGLKLARKVDALREDLSKEEQKRDLFINANTTELQKRLGELSSTIAIKEKEVEVLEDKKRELMKPLTLEWDKLKEQQKELEEKEIDLNNLKSTLTLLQGELDRRSKELSIDESRHEELKKEINIQVEKVSNASLEAQNTLIQAREEEKRILSIARIKEGNVVKKEKELSLRESAIVSRESQLSKEEKEIINEKIRLADMRRTLERAISKYKNE